MKFLESNKTALIIIIIVSCFLFWQFFIKGMHPFPGNFLLAWFEPWKTDHFVNNTITIIHKPVAEDVFRQVYPFKTLAIDLLKQGEFPLWNQYNGAGMPLFATINSGFLDPFNILYFFFSYPFAWSASIILQAMIIGFFSYLFAKKLGLGQLSSLFTALVFLLSGFVTTRLVYGVYGVAIAMLPLLLYLIESYVQETTLKRIFFLPIAIAVLIFSTQPQISFYILLTVFFYAVFRLYASKILLFSKETATLILLSIIGVGISSIQLFPSYELYRQTNITKEASTSIIESFILPPAHLLSLLIPNYFGNEGTYNYWGAANYTQTVVSLGLIPMFFALFGLGKQWKKKSSTKTFFLFLGVLSALSAIDWLGTKILYKIPLPIISTGAPSRIFLLTTFSFSILAGYGFEKFLKTGKLSKEFFVKTGVIFLGVIGVLAKTFLLYQSNTPCPPTPVTDCFQIALRNTVLELGVFVLSFLLLFSFLTIKNKRQKIILPLIFFLVVAAGYYNATKYIPFSSSDSFFPKNGVVSTILQKTSDARVFGIGSANIQTDFATMLRFYDPDYYHPMYIFRYRQLVDFANSGRYQTNLKRGDVRIAQDATLSASLAQKREMLFDITSVKYLLFKREEIEKQKNERIIWEDSRWFLTERSSALPRIYPADSYVVQKEPEKILETLFATDFDRKNSVVLEETPIESIQKIKEQPAIVLKKYASSRIEMDSFAKSPYLLVLTDNFYPGWQATVDDKDVTIYRTNYAFRSVVVPNGSHKITFTYKPASFQYGLAGSGTSLLLLLTIFLLRRRLFPTRARNKQ